MASSERIKLVQDAIVTHLKTVGPHDWDEIQKDYLDIPTSSFWRYVKKAKEQLERSAVVVGPLDLFAENKRAEDKTKAWENPNTNSVFRVLNHCQRFYELHSDLLALRQHALDPNGQIRDPQLFAKTIRLRNQLLNDELNTAEGVAHTDLNTKLFDAMIEAIAKASPEVAKAVIVSLERVNEEIKPKNSRVPV